MNKTVINKRSNVGAEEYLDTAIYYCLNVLTKRHTPTDEFKKIFVKNMFTKPNTKAFIHVVHFLFNIYDAKEFKKRFFWPIFDKHAENSFRTSTVEYVNVLIERQKIEMEKIKAYTVVLPGGNLRRSGAQSKERPVITKADIPIILEHHNFWVETGIKMKEIFQKDTIEIKAKINKISTLLFLLFKDTNIAAQMSFKSFMQLWHVHNLKTFEETENRKLQLKAITEKYDAVLEMALTKLEPKEIVLQIDVPKLKEALYSLEKVYPDNALNFRDIFDEHNKTDIIKMIDIVDFLMPDLIEAFSNFSCRSFDAILFEFKEISKLVVKSDELCNEMNFMSRNLPFTGYSFKDNSFNQFGENRVRNNVIGTPSLPFNFLGVSAKLNIRRARLALSEDDQMNHQINMKKMLLTNNRSQMFPKTPKSSRKKVHHDSIHGNTPKVNVNHNSKMNPLSMLNQITAQGKSKPSKRNQNTSNISTISEISMLSTMRPEFSSTLLASPDKNMIRRSLDRFASPELHSSPKMSQQIHRMNSPLQNFNPSPRYRTLYSENIFETKATMSPDSLLLLSHTTTRNSIIQIQKSPSGRLESLIDTQIPENHPKLQLNNESMESNSSELSSDDSNSKTIHNKEDVQKENSSPIENNTNLSNTLIDFNFDKFKIMDDLNELEDEEDLFNISNGVLNDIE